MHEVFGLRAHLPRRPAHELGFKIAQRRQQIIERAAAGAKVTNQEETVRRRLGPRHLFHETMIARAIQNKVMVNPLDATYWSMVPSRLGERQMKFSATPCANAKFLSPSNSNNRLGENLTATLAGGDACFIFRVQLRGNPQAMPIEDATIEWSEKQSPPIPVARITIPRQKPEQGEFCEALSFNPWNGLTEHRPLGGISRARKEVYQEISRLRHNFNKQKREEPLAASSAN